MAAARHSRPISRAAAAARKAARLPAGSPLPARRFLGFVCAAGLRGALPLAAVPLRPAGALRGAFAAGSALCPARAVRSAFCRAAAAFWRAAPVGWICTSGAALPATAFVQEYDSELVYVYALARGDADDAADLIEYLNAEVGSNPNGGTAWAEVRAANGHKEPYNVRYFEIGNEMNQGGADGTTAQTYWIDDVPGGALEGYVNGGTASFTRQYVVAQDDWNVSASYSDGSRNQEFCLRYARVERDEKAE